MAAAAVAAQESAPLCVGFVGAGRMAEAIAQGFIRAGKVEARHILASAPTDRNLCHLQALGCRTTHSNQEVLQNCLLVFFATKPHVLPAVLAEVASVVSPEHILVSVAAGVPLSTLEELLPPMARVLRVSPNLPCMVQEGAMVLARGHHAGGSEAKLLRTLLEACGQCEEVPEALMDIHTGLSGSGVAFVCAFSEALAEGAIKMGMPGGLAHRIATQTLLVDLPWGRGGQPREAKPRPCQSKKIPGRLRKSPMNRALGSQQQAGGPGGWALASGACGPSAPAKLMTLPWVAWPLPCMGQLAGKARHSGPTPRL